MYKDIQFEIFNENISNYHKLSNWSPYSFHGKMQNMKIILNHDGIVIKVFIT